MTAYNPCYKTEKLNLNTGCLYRPAVHPQKQPDTEQPLRSRVARQFKQWLHNWHSRRQLAQLDTGMLKDIGLSRADALAEADKPFWR